jgi:exopolysaccharide biosynthesis polyprenyl glycosylphosphotransferase
MIRRNVTGLRLSLLLADAALAALVVIGVSYVRFGPDFVNTWTLMAPSPWALLALYVVGWVSLLWLQQLYDLRPRWSLRSEALGVAQAAAWLAVVTFGLLYLLRLPDVSRSVALAVFPLQAAATILTRAGLRQGFQRMRRQGRNVRTIVVLGTGPEAQAFASQVEDRPDLGLRIGGFLGDEASLTTARWPYLGPARELPAVVHRDVVDEVAVCLPPDQWRDVEDLVGFCIEEGKIVRVPVDLPWVTGPSRQIEDLDGTPVLSIVTGPDRAMAMAVKRLIDIVGASVGLVVLSPLFAIVALTIVAGDGRPVVFRQVRAGLHGRRFRIVKFRTMGRDADALRAALRVHNEVKGNAAFKMTHDPRVTRLGRWLRRTSIDELPQLWNVLMGEMSLVGPRPHPFDDVDGYDVWHRRRLSMKPGMTGLWQVHARRDGDFDNWVRDDLDYIDRWSLWLDLRLLMSTIPAMLRSEGR